MQNGNSLGGVTGNNTITIAQENLSDVNFTGTANTGGNHNHRFWTSKNDVNNSESQGWPAGNKHDGFRTTDRRNRDEDNGTIQNGGEHSHSVTVSSGGSGSSLDITPQSLSVNVFIYLGN